MRENLKKARREAGMTQQQMADKLGISLRHNKYIEAGRVIGNIQIWDDLEDITGINQRKLREIADSHPGKEDRQ